MKKLLLILLCLMLSLSACTAPVPTETTQPTIEESTMPALPTPEEQAALILSQRSVWEQEDFSEYDRWFYTITDLDHNGRLEVLAAVTQGTGVFTTGVFCEVSEDYQSLTQYSPEDGEDWPEIIVEKAICYAQPGAYRYAFINSTRNGAAESWLGKQWVGASDGKITVETLAWKHGVYDWQTQKQTEEYTNEAGSISQEAFDDAFETAGQGMQVSTVHFDWVHNDELDTAEKIFANYQVFAGERKLARSAEMELAVFLEGMPEKIPTQLVQMEDYSFYLPVAEWTQGTEQMAGEYFDVWHSTVNANVQLAVGKLAGMRRGDAVAWVRQQYPQYTFEDTFDVLTGQSQTAGQYMSVQLFPELENTYVAISSYPLAAAEGFGGQMYAITSTLKID